MAAKAHYLIEDATGKVVNTVLIELDDPDPKYGWTPPEGHSVVLVESVKELDEVIVPEVSVERTIKAKDKTKAHKLVDRDYETLKAEADKKPKG